MANIHESEMDLKFCEYRDHAFNALMTEHRNNILAAEKPNVVIEEITREILASIEKESNDSQIVGDNTNAYIFEAIKEFSRAYDLSRRNPIEYFVMKLLPAVRALHESFFEEGVDNYHYRQNRAFFKADEDEVIKFFSAIKAKQDFCNQISDSKAFVKKYGWNHIQIQPNGKSTKDILAIIHRHLTSTRVIKVSYGEFAAHFDPKTKFLFPIGWDGDERLFIFFFDNLKQIGVLNGTLTGSAISAHFINEDGVPFNHKHFPQQRNGIREETLRNSEIVTALVTELKNFMGTDIRPT